MEIYVASKEQRLAWLIRRYSILSDTRIKCKICNEKIEQTKYLDHLNYDHRLNPNTSNYY